MSSDTPSRPATAGRRGPLRQHPSRRPTGYRTDEVTRLELEVAAVLFADSTLQGVIQRAVDEYLEAHRKDRDFVRAVNKAKLRQSAGIQPSSGG